MSSELPPPPPLPPPPDAAVSDATTSAPKVILPEPLTALSPPPDVYYIDQLKNGSVVSKLSLVKNRIVFGRARDCDVALDHPSISRYHATLLWCPKNDDNYRKEINKESFWYLIDCGSTHGTVCNKAKVDTGKMVKVIPNNSVIKFGASTRIFLLCSNEEERTESETEHQREVQPKNVASELDNACTWGMALTDADDDNEETGDSLALKEIISALKEGQSSIQSDNESVYSDNPYKCIQQWFEREEQDFDFKVDTVNGKFKCTVEIPVDGQWIPIEGSITNKKKEAIADACLKCCKILDKALLLFPWQKQNAAKKSRNQYDDDDDDLLDETVKVNKKIKKEIQVNNYETLNAKWREINEELCKLKVKLATIGLEADVKPDIPAEITDSLDIYLATMNKTKYGLTLNQKIEKSNLRMQIKQLETEQTKIERLIEIAKPVEIVIVGKPPKIEVPEKVPPKAEPKAENPTKPVSTPDPTSTSSKVPKVEPSKPKVSKSKLNHKLKQASIIEAIEREKQLESHKAKEVFVEQESDFVDWLPPSNQLGDGKTSLNEKFGY